MEVLHSCRRQITGNLATIRFDVSDAQARLHCLPATPPLSKHFATHLPDETIHILVEVPALGHGECGTRISYSTTEPRILLAENESPPGSLTDLQKERQQFAAGLSKMAPSSAGFPSEFSELQQKPAQHIMWSRPPGGDATIPVTLLHPILRRFVDDCENHQPVRRDNELVLEMMENMNSFFPNKAARAAELRDILTEYGIPVSTATITSGGRHFLIDNAVSINGYLGSIIEVRSEIGSRGAEPYAQGILHYAHSNAKKSKDFPKFNFPCLVITVFGQRLPSSILTY